MQIRFAALLVIVPVAVLRAAWPLPPAFIFEPNRGQAEPQIRYLGRGAATSVAFSDGGILFRHSSGTQPLELRFAGRNADAKWEPLDPLPTSTSYFLGKDPEHWIAGVPHSRRLIERGIYPGVDLIFYGQDGRLEFDFVVSAHADPRQIRLGWSGTARHTITPAGDLELADGTGARLVCAKPAVYQERESGRVPVEGQWVAGASSHEARFALGAYDPSLPLTIDPVIDTAAYIGGAVHAGVTLSSR